MAYNCTISFGMVNLRVQLHASEQRSELKLTTVGPQGEAVRNTYVRETDGAEIQRSDLLKAYEGNIVSKDALKAVDEAVKNRNLAVRFVDATEVPWWRTTGFYYVGIDPKEEKTYRGPFTLLLKAIEQSGKVAIGKWTPVSREQLVALWVREDGVLIASTLSFATAVKGVPTACQPVSTPLSDDQIQGAVNLIAGSEGDKEVFTEAADKALELKAELIQQVLEGQEIEAPEPASVPGPSDPLQQLLAGEAQKATA